MKLAPDAKMSNIGLVLLGIGIFAIVYFVYRLLERQGQLTESFADNTNSLDDTAVSNIADVYNAKSDLKVNTMTVQHNANIKGAITGNSITSNAITGTDFTGTSFTGTNIKADQGNIGNITANDITSTNVTVSGNLTAPKGITFVDSVAGMKFDSGIVKTNGDGNGAIKFTTKFTKPPTVVGNINVDDSLGGKNYTVYFYNINAKQAGVKSSHNGDGAAETVAWVAVGV